MFILIGASLQLAEGNIMKMPKLCLDMGEPKCEMKSLGGKLVCRKDYKALYHKEYWKAKSVILCSWLEQYVNPEEILTLFPVVRKLIIRNGNVSELLTDFPASEHLESLVMRNLLINNLRETLFVSLKSLKYLDLRENQLTNLNPDIIYKHTSLKKVLLADNPWNCVADLKWTVDEWIGEKLADVGDMLCSDKLYPGKPVKLVMFLMQAMESECPEEYCSCSMVNIVWDTNKSYLVPVITVNCSGQGLIELPQQLPLNTTTLILKQNNITDLLSLVKRNIYDNIADIYLDDNNIRNVDVLEGALWLSKFRVLSLKGNHLKELPTYALDNAFEKNTNMAKIYLGNNPWKCDCLFASDFQHLLIKYRSVIKDKSDIRCADMEGDDNSFIQVLDISIASMCGSDTSDFNPLDVLSGVLATLIILVIGKLMYDYWTFKRTGKLPWLVAKMP